MLNCLQININECMSERGLRVWVSEHNHLHWCAQMIFHIHILLFLLVCAAKCCTEVLVVGFATLAG